MSSQLKQTIEYHLKKSGYSKRELADHLGIGASALSHKLSGKNPWEPHEIRIISETLGLNDADTQDLYALAGFAQYKVPLNEFELNDIVADVLLRGGYVSAKDVAKALGLDLTDMSMVMKDHADEELTKEVIARLRTSFSEYITAEQQEWLDYYIKWHEAHPFFHTFSWDSLHRDSRELRANELGVPPNAPNMIGLSQVLDKDEGDEFLRIHLADVVEKYRDQQVDIAVVLLDIDELTIINKQYGLEVGNKVLLTVGDILYMETKDVGLCGRCGDDTYYAVLVGVDIERATRFADQLRWRIKIYPWPGIAADLRVSCSVGVAQWSKNEDSLDMVVRASIGMMKAKEKGRDQTVRAPEHLAKKLSRDLRRYYS